MRAFSKLPPFCFFLMLSFFYAFAASAAVQPHGGMMRYPDVSSTHIVFVYADDIWLAQLSQLGIEISTFDSARVVSFHHKSYYSFN